VENLKYTIIKTQKQYDNYCKALEILIFKDQKKNLDEIDLLGLLIEEYTNRKIEKYNSNLNPVELLSELILENKFTQVDLAKKLSVSPQLISDVLKYRREITKKMAYKLGKEFKLNFAIFLKPYKLKQVG